jgi:hypothetical protein
MYVYFLSLMSSTCFEPDGSSSGGRLYVQLWYVMLYIYRYEKPVAQRDASGKNQGFFNLIRMSLLRVLF